MTAAEATLTAADGSREEAGADLHLRNAALCAVAYFGAAAGGHLLSPWDDGQGFFWLPAGLLVAALLLAARPRWPALLLGALVGDAAFGVLFGLTGQDTAIRFSLTASQAVMGAVLVEGFVRKPFRLATPVDLLGFLLMAAFHSTFLAAVVGVALTSDAPTAAEFAAALWPRWGSNAMGVLILAPHVLVWSEIPSTPVSPRAEPRRIEALVLTLVSFASIAVVFLLADGIASPLRIALAVPAVWAAMRFGLHGATVVHLVLSMPVAFFTSAAIGNLPASAVLSQAISPAQTLLALVASTGLTLAVVLRAGAEQMAALRDSEARFRLFVDYSPIGVGLVDRSGRWLEANPPLCRMLGYAREELLDLDSLVVTHPEDLATELLFVEDILAGRSDTYRIEKRYLRKSGGELWVQVDVAAVRSDGGNPLYFLANVQDITERREAGRRILQLNATLEQRVAERTGELQAANRELELANRELEAFSASVSHDLRAPLRRIDGFSQIIARDHLGPEDAKGHADLGRIRAAARRMDELIDSMLRLARVTRGRLRREAVDLSAIAEESVAALRRDHPQRSVRVTIAPGLAAWGNPTLLRSVVDNLVGNAWKFTSKTEEARIEVGRESRNGEEMFFVSDNGVGFNPAFADQLFRAFHRLHDEDEFPGSGIGLATTQRILQRHGGRIEADGDVGEGAVFWFTVGER